jgi:outer membrane biosynthesis protein TonB
MRANHVADPKTTILRTARQLLCAVAVLGVLLGQPSPAAAQDDTAQAKAHYVKGKEHLAAGRLQDAAREFKKAYMIKRIPAILFNIAQVYRKLGDSAMAMHFFEKFIQEAPATDANRKEAKAILDELKAAGTVKAEPEAAPKPEPKPKAEPAPKPEPKVVRGEEPPPPPRKRARKARVDVFTHEAVDEVPPDKPMDVTCQAPDREGIRVTLFYRVAGQESYTPVVMKERLGEWVGRIQAREMSGKSIQYYIDAKDAKGKSIGNSGSAANPNIVLISVAARPHYYAEMGDEGKGEDFVVAPRKKEKPKLDRTPRDLRIWKWAAVGASAALVGGAAGLYYQAGLQKKTLQDKANSRVGQLPASAFSDKLKQIQDSGKLNMMLGSVCIAGAVVFAGGAVLLFVFDESKYIEKEPKEKDTRGRAAIAPLLGPTMVGVSGAVIF